MFLRVWVCSGTQAQYHYHSHSHFHYHSHLQFHLQYHYHVRFAKQNKHLLHLLTFAWICLATYIFSISYTHTLISITILIYSNSISNIIRYRPRCARCRTGCARCRMLFCTDTHNRTAVYLQEKAAPNYQLDWFRVEITSLRRNNRGRYIHRP